MPCLGMKSLERENRRRVSFGCNPGTQKCVVSKTAKKPLERSLLINVGLLIADKSSSEAAAPRHFLTPTNIPTVRLPHHQLACFFAASRSCICFSSARPQENCSHREDGNHAEMVNKPPASPDLYHALTVSLLQAVP